MVLGDVIEGDLIDYAILYRVHASRPMFQRDISEDDVELILEKGNIVERYDQDYPLPSLLLSGTTKRGKQLHVVAAVNPSEKKLIVITAYLPDPLKWIEGFSRRLQ